MTKWEYKVFEIKRSIWRLPWYHPPLKLKMDGKLLHEKINELGTEGWELVPLTFEEEEIFKFYGDPSGIATTGPKGHFRRIPRNQKFIHLKYVTFKRLRSAARHFVKK